MKDRLDPEVPAGTIIMSGKRMYETDAWGIKHPVSLNPSYINRRKKAIKGPRPGW
jgi:hypothetical protein